MIEQKPIGQIEQIEQIKQIEQTFIVNIFLKLILIISYYYLYLILKIKD